MQATGVHNILIVHQSTDLYGSDRNILSLAKGMDKALFHPIVAIPGPGPLADELARHGIECHVCELLKLSRATFSLRNALAMPLRVRRSMRSLDRAVGRRRISLVHSNTLAVLSGAVWAKLRGVPHLWNVREMILRPAVARYIFPLLLHTLSDRVVTNSGATRQLLVDSLPAVGRKTFVVWNGVDRDTPPRDTARDRAEAGIADGHVCVTLAGRINRWKGQGLLVDAAELLWEQGIHDLRFLMVGSPPPGQEMFETRLRERIGRAASRQAIQLRGFAPDIWPIWDLTDIAVIPSTEPEPFGMVAIEAMLAGKPVVAANHGGLAEIVLPGVTGELVPPNDPAALAECIRTLAADPDLRRRLGDNGRRRALEHFSTATAIQSFHNHYLATVRNGDA